MAYSFSKIISNTYLNQTKIIKAPNLYMLHLKVQDQLNKWSKQEAEQREKKRQQQEIQREKEKIQQEIQAAKNQVEMLNKECSTKLNQYMNILTYALKQLLKINWDNENKKMDYEDFSYPPIQSPPPYPNIENIYIQFNVPSESLLEIVFKSMKEKRLNLENQARNHYSKLCMERDKEVERIKIKYAQDKENALKQYQKKKQEFLNSVKEYNQKIYESKENYESGNKQELLKVWKKCLRTSKYPKEFNKNRFVDYDENSQIAVITMELPDIDSIPKEKEYKYIAASKTIKSVEYKKKELDDLYNAIIKQTCLRMIYELFSYDYTNKIQSIIFNGWINSINKATGNDYTACIISLKVNREDYESINFHNIDVDECIKSLKGLYAGNLALLSPVKPIMEIDKNDSRFVASRDVIDKVNSGENLATMDWEEFEHLVRELFSKYFSKDGGEVKVTQSSRDGGVDAIAFDSDPIKGGKYVIQAKRYNRVVPVAAVRDLYGTMMNEGAVKGILVTTSYFGNDSLDFIKDKPMTLIDGNNLIYMLSEFGYNNVHIELQK